MRFGYDAVLWIDVCVCLPLTLLFICCVCCVKQRDQVSVIYYRNLLISNLILLCITFFRDAFVYDIICSVIYCCGAMARVCFKMCIVLERYFFIVCPLLDCFRQTKGSVLVCLLIWTLCIFSVTLAIILAETLRLIVYALLPAPLFIFCLVGTLKALPAATSVSTEDKRRIVATLILLLFDYFLINLTAIILVTLDIRLVSYPPYYLDTHDISISPALFLVSSLVDLILFVFMAKGPIDKLLARLCCCIMGNTAAETSSRSV